MVGLERTVLPLLAEQEFGLTSKAAVLSFLIGFGVAKAFANLAAGGLSDRIGRKRILIAGWLVGVPVPFLIIYAPTWDWVLFANVLLGVNQGLCWSMTVVMKIDLVGAERRGLALGLNEFAGYFGVSLSALATGYVAAAYALRPQPFLPGVALVFLGLLLSVVLVRETTPYARREAEIATPARDGASARLSLREVVRVTTWRDRALFSASQAGMVNNLNDGVVWGLLPVFLLSAGLPVEQVGIVAATYPGVWGIAQLGTGALSDRWGRKWLIVGGMWVQAAGISLFVLGGDFTAWLAGSVLLGVGTALVYPTLLAAISDVAHPDWRASAVGVYRLWRDLGYAIAAVFAGLLADVYGVPFAIGAVAALTFLSGAIAAGVMYETLPARRVTR
ncbi:MAG: MFS transporter [Euryarchaeota archaeon]|nr:MFS transporter [Euryarchaeota archaeon]